MSDGATTVTASGAGAIAAGRDVHVGISGAELIQAVQLASSPEAAAHAELARILAERVPADAPVQRGAVANFLRILGESDVPAEQLDQRLDEIAERHVSLIERLTALASDDPAVASLRGQAAGATKRGDYDAADALLDAADTADARAIEVQQQMLDRRKVSRAATLSERGELAMTRLRYRDAAEHFRAAAALLPADEAHRDARLAYGDRAADALYRQGAEFGDKAALEEAVAAYRAALEEWTRERVPLNWATTQNNLGTALRALGVRESGTARLEQAVAAHRAALEERTRERVPLQWATTQNNLGNALATLGERESGTARLEEAVAACRAALEERTRERVPLDWATTQNNLGAALLALGERESGTARLGEAVAGHRAALEERTRERVPLQWATTQNNLGNALRALGARRDSGGRPPLTLNPDSFPWHTRCACFVHGVCI